ncbi:unnamed protein product [Gordionus sp. m RMFG-2023]|uniref:GRIP and coiled-coil domain-containing protein-like n=1 Tax=Gordionus sp. m RMFG-2023 TaxID=3053472 RepID=UPI0030E0F4C6
MSLQSKNDDDNLDSLIPLVETPELIVHSIETHGVHSNDTLKELNSIFQDQTTKLTNLIHNSVKIVGLEIDFNVLKSQHSLETAEYEDTIMHLNNKLKEKSALEYQKTSEATTLKHELAKIKEDYKKIKRDYSYNSKAKDEKLKAFQLIDKNFKTRVSEEKNLLQNKNDSSEKTLKRLNSELEIKKKEIDNDRHLIKSLEEKNKQPCKKCRDYSELLNNYELLKENLSSLIDAKKIISDKNTLGSLNNDPQEKVGHFYQTLKSLQNENDELKRTNKILNELSDKNYLIVNENENLRHQMISYQDMCLSKYPALQNSLENSQKEVREWRKLASEFQLEVCETGYGKKCDDNEQMEEDSLFKHSNLKDKREGEKCKKEEKIVTPPDFSFSMSALLNKERLTAAENSRLKDKLQILTEKLENTTSQLLSDQLEAHAVNISLKSAIANLKSFRENLTKIKPKSDKLKHYLEFCSIIPKGHSEYQNFKATFLILDSLLSYPISKEEKENVTTNPIN